MHAIVISVDTGRGGLDSLSRLMLANPGCGFMAYIDNGWGKAGDKDMALNEDRIWQVTDEAHDWANNLPLEVLQGFVKSEREVGRIEVISFIACNTYSIAYERFRNNPANADVVNASQKHVVTIPNGFVKEIVSASLRSGSVLSGLNNRGGLGRVLVMQATKATIDSGYYQKKIKTLWPLATIYDQACPGLADLVDDLAPEEVIEKELEEKYLNEKEAPKISDTGLHLELCTHYDDFRHIVEKIYRRHGAKNLEIIDPMVSAHEHLKKEIKKLKLRRRGEQVSFLKESFIVCTGEIEPVMASWEKITSTWPKDHAAHSVKVNFFKQHGAHARATFENLNRIIGAGTTLTP